MNSHRTPPDEAGTQSVDAAPGRTHRLDLVSDTSLATAALVAGTGLLLMAVLSMISVPLLEGFAVPGDPAATASNIAGNEFQFRLAVVGLLLVIALDVVVAWALYVFLAPVHASLSLLAAVFRLVYAAVFAAAVANLATILELLNGDATAGAVGTDQHVFANYAAFASGWDVGLALFGLHLVLVGYLVFRSEYVPRLLGLLLAVAGVGYLVDSFGVLLAADYGLQITLFTFVGEVVFFGWLLYRGRTIRRSELRVDEGHA